MLGNDTSGALPGLRFQQLSDSARWRRITWYCNGDRRRRCRWDRFKQRTPEGGVSNEIPDTDLEVVARLQERASCLEIRWILPFAALNEPGHLKSAWTGTG